MSARRLWQIGGSVVIVAILVLGWFAAVAPVLSQAGANELDRAAVEEQNAIHAATLAALQGEYENIGELRDQLAQLARAVPPDAATPDLLRDIATAAAESGVVISAIRTEDAVNFVAATSAAPEEATPSDTAEDTTEEGDDSEPEEGSAAESVPLPVTADPMAGVVDLDQADLALLAPDTFITVPISIEFVGAPDQFLAMASALQSMSRVFLITTFSIEGGEAPRGTIGGLVYVLVDENGVLTLSEEPAADSTEQEPTETPVP